MPAKSPKSNVRSGGAKKSTRQKAAKGAKKSAPRSVAAKKAAKTVAAAKVTQPPKKASRSASKKVASAAKSPAKKATKAPAAKARVPAKAAKSPSRTPVAKSAPKKTAAKVPAKSSARQASRKQAPKTTAAATKTAPTTTRPAPRPPIRPPRPEPKRLETGYTDEKFLAHQTAALERERTTYMEQANSLQAEADLLIAEMEPGDIQFDEESGEGGTVAVDRERDLALSAQALEAVAEIDAALEKIASGKYGICENCGQLIAKARLEALPYARLCIACKSGGLSRR
jgi:RNA polymerase-binding transcription factor DksA